MAIVKINGESTTLSYLYDEQAPAKLGSFVLNSRRSRLVGTPTMVNMGVAFKGTGVSSTLSSSVPVDKLIRRRAMLGTALITAIPIAQPVRKLNRFKLNHSFSRILGADMPSSVVLKQPIKGTTESTSTTTTDLRTALTFLGASVAEATVIVQGMQKAQLLYSPEVAVLSEVDVNDHFNLNLLSLAGESSTLASIPLVDKLVRRRAMLGTATSEASSTVQPVRKLNTFRLNHKFSRIMGTEMTSEAVRKLRMAGISETKASVITDLRAQLSLMGIDATDSVIEGSIANAVTFEGASEAYTYVEGTDVDGVIIKLVHDYTSWVAVRGIYSLDVIVKGVIE